MSSELLGWVVAMVVKFASSTSPGTKQTETLGPHVNHDDVFATPHQNGGVSPLVLLFQQGISPIIPIY